MSLKSRFVTAHCDRFGILKLSFLRSHVLRHVDENGTRSAAAGNVKRLFDRWR
jgi:hypothetical protein